MTKRGREIRQRRRAPWVLLLAAAIAAALWYLRCVSGFGFGRGGGAIGGGPGEEAPRAALSADAGVPRCQLRLSAQGITVDGRAVSQDQAVALCKRGGADVVVTGDARQGDWDALRARLDAEFIATFVRGVPPNASGDAGTP